MPRVTHMTDASSISNPPTLTAVRRPSGYGATHEVKLRANVNQGNDSPEQRVALKRLDRAMSAELAPRDDVPRGYYLDILV